MLFTFLFSLFAMLSFAESKEIPYTLEDRERLIKLEVRVDEGFKAIEARFVAMDEKFDGRFDSMQKQFDAVQKQIDFTNNLILTMIASLIGTVMYMWWDRSRANEPIKNDITEEKRKTQTMLNMLKEYSTNNPEFKAIFDRAAML
ncbi:MAG: hypothetical protein ACKVOU_02605 [Cytophagales bacterium]